MNSSQVLMLGQAVAKRRGIVLDSAQETHLRAFGDLIAKGEGHLESIQREVLFKAGHRPAIPRVLVPLILPEMKQYFGKSVLVVDGDSGSSVVHTTLLEQGLNRVTAEPASLFELATKVPALNEAFWPQLAESTPALPDAAPIGDLPDFDEFSETGSGVVSWKKDGVAAAQFDPTFEQKRIKTYEVSGYSECSRELFTRAGPNFINVIRMAFRTAMLHSIDQNILLGSGINRPKGYLTEDILSVNRAAPNEISYDDLVDMESALAPQYRANAVWVMSKGAFKNLKKKKDLQNRPLYPKLGGPKPTLNEYPVIVTQRAPVLGSAGDISLGDFSQYVCPVEEDLYLFMSEHAKASQGLVCSYASMNLGGKVVRNRAFVKLT